VATASTAPQEWLLPRDGLASTPTFAEATWKNFLDNFFEPQCGHSESFQSVERTRISLSRSHFSHGIRKSAWKEIILPRKNCKSLNFCYRKFAIKF